MGSFGSSLSLGSSRPMSFSLGSLRFSFRPSPLQATTSLGEVDRKSTRLNSSHTVISYAVFCLKKKKRINMIGEIGKEWVRLMSYCVQGCEVISALLHVIV